MEINLYEAIELIKQQIKEQGCVNDDFETLNILQPHIYEWIRFFDLKESDLK